MMDDLVLLGRTLAPPTIETVQAAVARACARIAPVWPLADFVAVNPFVGLSGMGFAEACDWMGAVAGAEMLPPRSAWRAALREGRLTCADLDTALARHTGPHGLDRAALLHALHTDRTPPTASVPDVADLLGQAAFVAERISAFCAAWFDEGQAAWPLDRGPSMFAAWRDWVRHDRTPDAAGLPGLRQALWGPADPLATIEAALARLGVRGPATDAILHRALLGIGGWAGFARGRGWVAALDGRHDDTLQAILAIRLAWDAALLATATQPQAAQWRAALATVPTATPDPAEHAPDLLLLEAAEIAVQRRIEAGLARSASAPDARPAVQAAFCIDVRSEPYRRAFEQAIPGVETIGFAGFYGVAMEWLPRGAAEGLAAGRAQCPVLLQPGVRVCEAVLDGAVPRMAAWQRMVGAWRAWKGGAASCFPFVEVTGLAAGLRLVADGFGWRRARQPGGRPDLEPGEACGHPTGIASSARVDTAEAVLRAMSLARGTLARLVLLAGHEGASVNNPHAAGLDCGACGGHGGGPNARVVALLLNDPSVRAGLAARGLVLPSDSWVLAATHDTTSDDVALHDTELVPPTHLADLAALEAGLDAASHLARLARAPGLGVTPEARRLEITPAARRLDMLVRRRTRDWAQVRPEWALAGNAAFIAAPRARTRGMDLEGRAFLHSYDWRQDTGFATLTLILTAPMVVASWINLQYYGSVVDNRVFGAGDKVLHNLVGGVGVLEGNGGDLRVGLPWQSLHDGTRLRHDPVRLSVYVDAPLPAIEAVLDAQPDVAALVRNGWLHLFRVGENGHVARLRKQPG